jgi:hypothetical protein
MLDRSEAKELHLSAIIEINPSVDERQLQDTLESMLKSLARETGVMIYDIHLMRVGEVEPGTIEAEADWLMD